MFAAISARATDGATSRAITARTADISIGDATIGELILLRTLPALLLLGLIALIE